MSLFNFALKVAGQQIPAVVTGWSLKDMIGAPGQGIFDLSADNWYDLPAWVNQGQVELDLIDHGIAYSGQITRIQRAGRRIRITTHGPDHKYQMVRRSRTFAHPGIAGPISELPQLTAAFPDVANLNLLTAEVDQITQYQDTDFRLLRRLAAMSHRIVTGECNSGLAIRTLNPGGSVTLEEHEIDTETEHFQARLINTTTSETIQDLWSGTFGNTATSVVEQAIGGQRVQEWLGSQPGEANWHDWLPANITTAVRALCRATTRATGSLRWKADTTNLTARLGMEVHLPPSRHIDTPLWVTQRTLAWGQIHGKSELRNRLCLRPVGIAPSSWKQPCQIGVSLARVTSTYDDRKLGRIRVQLPWQPAGESCWAWTMHNSAGTQHGDFNGPDVQDWVRVLMLPAAGDLPLVLGAAYRGNAPTPVPSVSTQRVLLCGNGVELVAQFDQQILQLLIKQGDEITNSLKLSGEGVEVFGDLILDGGTFKIV